MEGNINESKEYFNCIGHLRDLDLNDDDKRKLLANIAVMMSESANHATQFSIAAMLGLDTEDPKFRALYDNELGQIVKIDANSIFKTLRELVMDEKDGEYKCQKNKTQKQNPKH